MTEKQFLKNFKKHCEIARDLGLFLKGQMEVKLRNGNCPFNCQDCKYKNTSVVICGNCEKEKRYRKLDNEKTFESNSEYYAHSKKLRLVPQMLSILKSIPWRSANGKP